MVSDDVEREAGERLAREAFWVFRLLAIKSHLVKPITFSIHSFN